MISWHIVQSLLEELSSRIDTSLEQFFSLLYDYHQTAEISVSGEQYCEGKYSPIQ